MLNVINLNFDYPDKPLLTSINLKLSLGEVLHLRGDNGSGKTTLIKLIAGLLPPDHGDIQYQGHSIYQDLLQYQKKICYVGHKTGVSHLLSPIEVLSLELNHQKPPSSLTDLVRHFHLESVADVPCGLLSVGQRRRVALLRLALTSASLWLLDEPFVALDKKSIEILMFYIDKHIKNGGAILVTSHQVLPLNRNAYQEYIL